MLDSRSDGGGVYPATGGDAYSGGSDSGGSSAGGSDNGVGVNAPGGDLDEGGAVRCCVSALSYS